LATAAGLFAAEGCHHKGLPPRPDGAAVVVAEDVPTDVPSTEEKEPNDTLATATPLTFGEAGALMVRAALEAPDAKGRSADLYRLTIPPPPVLVAEAKAGGAARDAEPGPDAAGAADAGAPSLRQRLSVVVAAEGGGVVVEALDERGSVLMSDTAGEGESAGFPNWSVLPGAALLRVRWPAPAKSSRASAPHATAGSGAGGAGGAPSGPKPYRVTLRLATPEPGDEAEPNGKAALAVSTTADDEVAGYFGWRRDEDWYRVDLGNIPEGNLLSLDLAPVTGVAASLAVYDLAEHRLLDRKGRKEEALALRDLGWPKGQPAVFIVVRAETGKNPDERYRLRIRNQPASPDTEIEPNDDLAHAVPLNEGLSQGTLGRGDVDVFRFKLEEARIASLEVTPPERVDVKVDLLRESDGASLAHLDQGRRHEPEGAPNLFLVPGSYAVRLTTAAGDGNPDEPYQIAFALRTPDTGEEREPNESQNRATLLSPGAAAHGFLAPRGDVDTWRFDHPVAAPAASLAIEGVPDLNLDVRVSTAQGKEIARGAVSPGGRTALVVPPVSDACCFIQLREKTGKLMNSRDSYGLTLATP
jgi:hypothetical protein